MVATVRVLDNGSFKGASSNLTGYSFKEESVSLNPADSSGGVPEFNFEVVVTDDTPLLYKSRIEVLDADDASEGRLTGTVSGVDISDATASVPVQSHLGALVATRALPPVSGTLSFAIRKYMDECGLASTTLVFSAPVIGNRLVAYPGGEQEVWTWIKEIMAAQQLLLTPLASGPVLISPAGNSGVLTQNFDVSRGLSISEGDLARSVEIKYYNNVYANNEMVYPAGGWNDEVEVYQVGAGEVTDYEIELGVSVMSFKQPTMVSYVASGYSGPNSVYAIAGNDGLPVPAALWRDAGGKVELELLEDTQTFRLNLTGPVGTWADNYAPFRVAMAADSGGGSTYSSLRIVGRGIFMHEESVIVPTGVEDKDTAQEVGITVESQAIASREDALNVAPIVAAGYAGTLIEKSSGLSRNVASGALDGAWLGGLTLLLVETADSQYRIRTANYGPAAADYIAEPYVRFSDLDDRWGDMTFAQMESLYSGMTFTDLAIKPLLPAKKLPQPW